MLRFITLLLSLFLSTALVSGAKYDGNYKLSSAEDEKHAPVNIPSGNKPFHMVLRSESDSHYMLSFRLGNTMRADVRVTPTDGPNDDVHVGDMMSTMMMPPENIFKLEHFISKTMPTMTKIYLSEDDNKLILEGAARVEFTRDLTDE